MRIVIVGGGVVGFSVAEMLVKENHQLSLIEQDPALSQILSEKLDIQVMTGSGSSPDILREAGIADADMVVAVTPNDEVNMVVCALAAQHDVGTRIARLRSAGFTDEYAKVDLERIGITAVIHPEKAVVDHILQYLSTPHAVESANFEDGEVLLRGYKVRDNMAIAGKTLQEIRLEIAPAVVLFAAIVRNGEGMIPEGKTRIEGGDTVYALFPREATETFLGLVGIERKKNRRVIVTGQSFMMMEMARAMDELEHKVTFVNPDLEQANTIAGAFDNIEVIHGDCTDPDVLKDVGVERAAFFVAASDEADYNIFSALLAKAEGTNEVIVTSTEARHDQLFNSIGIDHVINPRLTAAREILEIISRGQIGAVVELSDVDIEAVRYIVEPKSVIAGQKVKQIAKRLKRGAIIGVIVRDNRMIIPGGETAIEAGDHVIVITRSKHLSSLSKLFKVS